MSGSRTGQHYGSLNNHPSNHPGSPPPPYTVITPPPAGPPRNPSYDEEHTSGSDEMASLVNGNKVRRHSKARIALFSILGLYVIILTVLFTTTLVLLDERREWERERETNEPKRRGHVPFWGTARLLTAECPEDRIRQYDASMHNLLVEDDWYAACMNTAIDIAGRRLASPRTCMNYGLDGGVRGYWSIEVNSSECKRTIWDNLRNMFNKYCRKRTNL